MTAFNKNSLAACIAAYLATAAHVTCAATVAVTDCGDGVGLGTLRSIITNVVGTPSGSTVDMTACSTITLTAGAVTIAQNDLTLLGKSTITTVTAAASPVNDRIFTHTGNATLALDHVSAQHGNLYTSTFANKANGGCISSLGSVTLTDSSVSACVLGSTTYNAQGGGIYAKGALTLSRSSIADNTITHGYGVGGGAFVYGDFTATDSAISGNSSSSNTGGLYLSGNVTITSSTISGNHIDTGASGTRSYGGLRIVGDSSNFTASITNSTISGNSAQTTAGIHSSLPLTHNNSTTTNVTGAAPGGTTGTYPDRKVFSTALSYVSGSHALKTGAQWSFGVDGNSQLRTGDIVQNYISNAAGVETANSVTVYNTPTRYFEYVNADLGIYEGQGAVGQRDAADPATTL